MGEMSNCWGEVETGGRSPHLVRGRYYLSYSASKLQTPIQAAETPDVLKPSLYNRSHLVPALEQPLLHK